MRLRAVLPIACCLLVAAITTGCQGSGWSEYKPEGGRLAVQMPGTPKLQSQTVSTAAGDVELHVAMLQPDADTAYGVSWADYPQEAVQSLTADEVLDGARDGAVAKLNGTLAGSDNIMLSGSHPGRDLRVTMPDGAHVYRSRVYLIGNRLYQVIAVTTTAGASGPDVTKFLDSFTPLP